MIGVADGISPATWCPSLVEPIAVGVNIVCGMYAPLGDMLEPADAGAARLLETRAADSTRMSPIRSAVARPSAGWSRAAWIK